VVEKAGQEEETSSGENDLASSDLSSFASFGAAGDDRFAGPPPGAHQVTEPAPPAPFDSGEPSGPSENQAASPAPSQAPAAAFKWHFGF